MAQQLEAAREFETFYLEQKRLLQVKKLMKVSQSAISSNSKQARNLILGGSNLNTEPFGDSHEGSTKFKSSLKELSGDNYLS